jgi:hypothetical protein
MNVNRVVDNPLGALKSRLQTELEQLEQKRSSREAYLAVWKASPYFIISVTGLTLTSLVYNQAFVGIGIMAALAIFCMTVFCWIMTMKRDTEISSSGRGINELEKAVNNRIEFARVAFISYLPRLARLPSNPADIRFSDRPDHADKFNFDEGLVQGRIMDMTDLNPNLVQEMAKCDALFNEFESSRSLLSLRLSNLLDNPRIEEIRKRLNSQNEIKVPRDQSMINVLGMQRESLKQSIFREVAARISPLAFAFRIGQNDTVTSDLIGFMVESESSNNPFPEFRSDPNIRRLTDDVVKSFLEYQPVRLRVEELIRTQFGKDQAFEHAYFPAEAIIAR